MGNREHNAQCEKMLHVYSNCLIAIGNHKDVFCLRVLGQKSNRPYAAISTVLDTKAIENLKHSEMLDPLGQA